MKPLFPALFFLLLVNILFSCSKSDVQPPPPTPVSDSFTVSVTNGYGAGKYKTGDTVHIFSSNYTSNQLFDKWTGDVNILNSPNEWHAWFVMPNKNVSFTGSVKTSIPFSLQYEQIKGRDRLKPVYYYFPVGHKGIVYLLHGTQGSAQSVVTGFEFKLLITDLVNDNFGVIVTEAEESTLGADTNGDGSIRWALLPADSVTNVDYANIRIITDTFYNRGITSRTLPRYSVGMSDGGFFSAALSSYYNFKAGVNYCSQSGPGIISTTNTPIQFCMAANDNNPNVGLAGNATALANYNALLSRGVCSKYFLNPRSSIYPERFSRDGTISTALSISIYNELKSKGFIDNKNYFIGFSDAFLTAFNANRSNFPVINGLTYAQQTSMLAQINLAVADHHMYSDLNRATLKFLNTQCL